MNVEVLNTGTELLIGSVLNTHLPFFARHLFGIGFRIGRQVAVPDGEAIRTGLSEAFGRASIVLVTGGLGPTTDDLTRDITASLLGRPLRRDPRVMEELERRYHARGREVSERVARQAEVPEGARVLPNPHGTAPGLYLECAPGVAADHRVHLFLLPGPPRELYPMFEEIVLPMLREIAPRREMDGYRVYFLLGIGESEVEAEVGEELLAIPGLELGYCARPGEVEVRCIGSGTALEAAHTVMKNRLGQHIVSHDGRSVEQIVIEKLARQDETLATAESCTGGLLANRLTNIPGASAVFQAGYITYSNEAKSLDLGVNPILIETHGAVSAETATAMAEGAIRRSGAHWALSTTGIAGPGGGSPEKPVGTLFIALARHGYPTRVETHRFAREREVFKTMATNAALDLLRRAVEWRE